MHELPLGCNEGGGILLRHAHEAHEGHGESAG